jgi:hypothetical protein
MPLSSRGPNKGSAPSGKNHPWLPVPPHLTLYPNDVPPVIKISQCFATHMKQLESILCISIHQNLHQKWHHGDALLALVL